MAKLTTTSTENWLELFRFMRYDSAPFLCVNNIESRHSRQVQLNLVFDTMDKLFRMSKDLYMSTLRFLIERRMLPGYGGHYFSGVEEEPDAWSKQAWVDVSYMVAAAEIFDAEETNKNVITVPMGNLAQNVLEKNTNVSLRMRSYTSSGNGLDMNAIFMNSVRKIHGKQVNIDTVTASVLAAVDALKCPESGALPDLASAEDPLQEAATWFEDGYAEKVKEMALQLKSLPVSTGDGRITTARQWLQGVVATLEPEVSTYLKNECEGDNISKCLQYGSQRDEESVGEIHGLLQLVFDFFFFLDHLQDSFLVSRKDKTAFDELRERLRVLETILHIASENMDDVILRKLSDIWVQEQDIQVNAQFGDDNANYKSALVCLRNISVGPFIVSAVRSVLGVGEKDRDASFLPLLLQIRGSLPQDCAMIVDGARALEQAETLFAKVRKHETLSFIDIATVTASVRQFLEPLTAQHSNVADIVKKTNELFNNEFGDWKAGKQILLEAETLHDFFKDLLEEGVHGEWSKCRWVTDANNQDITEKMAKYQKIWQGATTNHCVVRSAVMALRNLFDDNAPEMVDVNNIMKAATFAKENQEEIMQVIGTASLGNLLLVSPRPPTFETDLKEMVQYFKRHNFIASTMLPKYFQNLFAETTSGALITKKEQSVTTTTASTASGSMSSATTAKREATSRMANLAGRLQKRNKAEPPVQRSQ